MFGQSVAFLVGLSALCVVRMLRSLTARGFRVLRGVWFRNKSDSVTQKYIESVISAVVFPVSRQDSEAISYTHSPMTKIYIILLMDSRKCLRSLDHKDYRSCHNLDVGIYDR